MVVWSAFSSCMLVPPLSWMLLVSLIVYPFMSWM
jgi:hypothetical protein